MDGGGSTLAKVGIGKNVEAEPLISSLGCTAITSVSSTEEGEAPVREGPSEQAKVAEVTDHAPTASAPPLSTRQAP